MLTENSYVSMTSYSNSKWQKAMQERQRHNLQAKINSNFFRFVNIKLGRKLHTIQRKPYDILVLSFRLLCIKLISFFLIFDELKFLFFNSFMEIV